MRNEREITCCQSSSTEEEGQKKPVSWMRSSSWKMLPEGNVEFIINSTDQPNVQHKILPKQHKIVNLWHRNPEHSTNYAATNSILVMVFFNCSNSQIEPIRGGIVIGKPMKTMDNKGDVLDLGKRWLPIQMTGNARETDDWLKCYLKYNIPYMVRTEIACI